MIGIQLLLSKKQAPMCLASVLDNGEPPRGYDSLEDWLTNMRDERDRTSIALSFGFRSPTEIASAVFAVGVRAVVGEVDEKSLKILAVELLARYEVDAPQVPEGSRRGLLLGILGLLCASWHQLVVSLVVPSLELAVTIKYVLGAPTVPEVVRCLSPLMAVGMAHAMPMPRDAMLYDPHRRIHTILSQAQAMVSALMRKKRPREEAGDDQKPSDRPEN